MTNGFAEVVGRTGVGVADVTFGCFEAEAAGLEAAAGFVVGVRYAGGGGGVGGTAFAALPFFPLDLGWETAGAVVTASAGASGISSAAEASVDRDSSPSAVDLGLRRPVLRTPSFTIGVRCGSLESPVRDFLEGEPSSTGSCHSSGASLSEAASLTITGEQGKGEGKRTYQRQRQELASISVRVCVSQA
jgi:hypothetical protein